MSISTAHDDGDDDEEDEQEPARQMIFHARWKEVESHIPMILAIREEGRAWAQSSSCQGSLSRRVLLVCYLTSLSEFIRPLHPIEYSSITIKILSDERLGLVQRRRKLHRALSMDRCI
jgi:hypothetical protein